MKIALIVGYITTGGLQTFLINLLRVLEFSEIKLDIYYIIMPDSIKEMFPQHNYIRLKKYSYFDKICTMLNYKVLYYFVKYFKNLNKSNEFSCIYLSYLSKKQRPIYTEYNKVISLSEHLCLYLNLCFRNTKKRICWIHPNYKMAKMDKNVDSFYLSKMDNIYAVSKNGAEALMEEFPDFTTKINYVENIINEDEIIQKSKEEVVNPFTTTNGLKLLTVCRMSNDSKRVDRLLRIAKELEIKKVDFQWVFIGDGPDTQKILNQANDLGLKNVVFLGNKSNPYPYFLLSDLFVLLSDYEGNPYVLKEARILKLPYLITDFDLNLVNSKYNCFYVSNNNDLIKNTVDFISNYRKCSNEFELCQERDLNLLLEIFK